MGFDKLKFGALPLFFGCCKSLIEKAPEIVSHLAEPGAAATASGAAAVTATALGAPAVLAAAILIPPVIEHVREKYRDKADARLSWSFTASPSLTRWRIATRVSKAGPKSRMMTAPL
jgi:hypothetical protein